MNTSKALSALALTCSIVLQTTAGHAVDGVIEINAANAAAGGINFGDAPGFPISISEPGSYRLTGNLFVGAISTSAITVGSQQVTIDLNGFSIFGADGGMVDSGVGISSTQGGVRIINGTVRDFGDDGIRVVGDNAIVENVRSVNNGGIGISVDEDARVSGCVASNNGSTGILAQFNSTVRDNVADDNEDRGIFCTQRCTITGNTVTGSTSNGIESNNGSMVSGNNSSSNQGSGIFVDDGATVTKNTTRSNGVFGIRVDDHSTVTHNTSTANDEDGIRAHDGCTISYNTSSGNGEHGICAFSGNSVVGNTVISNTLMGLDIGNTTGYGHNVIYDNTGGTVSAGAAEIGVNLCNGLNACP